MQYPTLIRLYRHSCLLGQGLNGLDGGRNVVFGLARAQGFCGSLNRLDGTLEELGGFRQLFASRLAGFSRFLVFNGRALPLSLFAEPIKGFPGFGSRLKGGDGSVGIAASGGASAHHFQHAVLGGGL